MGNERYNVWVWILCIVVTENYAIWLKDFGESNLGVIENSLMSLGSQKENVSNKENSPSHPWLYEWKVPKTDQEIQLKPFKIWWTKSKVQTESILISTRAHI